MNSNEQSFVMDVYGQKALPYIYYKDKFAVQQLEFFLEQSQCDAGQSISDLKKSNQAFLLDKPALKSICSGAGSKKLDVNTLQNYLPDDYLPFSITFDTWGAYTKHRKYNWYQTTRPGYSLVLQLNFTQPHDVKYYQLIKPKHKHHRFRWTCHPVKDNHTLTCAWARLDFDLNTGEVLIEEIQNDWLRDVTAFMKSMESLVKDDKKKVKEHDFFSANNTTFENLQEYHDSVLKPYRKMWDEAILSAAIWFSKRELGLNKIYYHTWETGAFLKDCEPPKSIYTKLPKKFGFKASKTAPQFIQECQYLKKTLRNKDCGWWFLEL